MTSTSRQKRNSENRFECPRCTYTTKYRDLHRHMKKHETAGFPCDECNMPFMTRGFLDKHKEVEHGIEREEKKRKFHQCEECDYSTTHYSDMARHRRRHVYATMSCKFCNRPFYNQGNLTTHIKHEHSSGNKRKVTGTVSNNNPEAPPRHCIENRSNLKTSVEKRGNDSSGNGCSRNETRTKNKSSDRKRKSDSKHVNENNFGKFYEKRTANIIDNDRQDTIDGEENSDLILEADDDSHKLQSRHEKIANNENTGSKIAIQNCGKTTNFKVIRMNFKQIADEDIADKETETRSLLNTPSKDLQSLDNDKNRRIMHCAFCEFSAASLKGMQKHLDTHEYDMDLHENMDSAGSYVNGTSDSVDRFSVSNTNVAIDSDDNMYLYQTDQRVESDYEDIDKSDPNESSSELAESTSSDRNMSVDVSLSNTRSSQESNESLGSLDGCSEHISSPFRSIQEVEHSAERSTAHRSCIDEVDLTSQSTSVNKQAGHLSSIVDECVDQIGMDGVDEFRKRPFACSKCLYRTGNLDYLRIHAEAHLYETKRATLTEKQRIDTLMMSANSHNIDSECIPGATDKLATFVSNNEVRTDTSSEVNAGTNNRVVGIQTESLTGRLNKEEFKRTKKCYKRHSSGDNVVFECLICELDNNFESKKELKHHFWTQHKRLREQICSSCSYCSKPFPK